MQNSTESSNVQTIVLVLLSVALVAALLLPNHRKVPTGDQWFDACTYNLSQGLLSDLSNERERFYIFTLEGRQFGFHESRPFVVYRSEIYVKKDGYRLRFYGQPLVVHDAASLTKALKTESRPVYNEAERIYRSMLNIAVAGAHNTQTDV